MGAFGGRLRQFSDLSDYSLSDLSDYSQLIFDDGEHMVSRPIHERFFKPVLLSAQHEDAEQAPIATVLRTANTAEQPAIGPAQSSKVRSLQHVRVDQRAKVSPRAAMHRTHILCFLFVVVAL